jgi:hypothetical protein
MGAHAMKTNCHFVVGALLAGAIGAYAETACAAMNAAAYCQGALPAFAGTLRARRSDSATRAMPARS